MSTLYRKYRPQTWADIADQEHVKMTLAAEVETGKIAHAYLFSGPRGVGKTTTARILARAVNCAARAAGKSEPCAECEHCLAAAENRSLDIIEIDAASHRGIDAVRENIIEHARFTPARAPFKVFIIDEVHMLTTEAFNALLKTLEEPPSHVMFILATTELHKVPATIVSRCQRFDFRKIGFAEVVGRLRDLAEREGCKVDDKAVEEIARRAEGSLRDAEGLLGKVLAVSDGKRVSYDDALSVLPRSNAAAVSEFVECLVKRDGRTALMTIGEGLEAGLDMEQFALDAVELLRKTLLAAVAGPESVAEEMDKETAARVGGWVAVGAGELARMIEMLLEARARMKISHLQHLPLELAAVKVCGGGAGLSPSAASGMAGGKGLVPESRGLVPSEASVPVPTAKSEGPVPPPKEEQKVPASADLEAVKAVWQEFIRKAGEENHSLPFVLGIGQPVDAEPGKVVLGFEFAFHRDKVNEEKNRRVLEKVLGELLGDKVRIDGILLEKSEAPQYSEPARPSAAVPQVLEGLVAAFGGKVVE
ncbi:DNA polymerase III subunit gamma/tau [Candidatus Uhrbacteria bacterium]|nr:DNA polymerase III subunit gamma/tau [Candidatus Uhrbacteria bacterium]